MMTEITERENTNRPESVLRELLVGILSIGLIVQIVCLFFSQAVFLSACWWCGQAVAVFYAIHMYRSISRALDLSEGDAISLVRYHSIIRYLAVVVVALLLFFLLGQENRRYGLMYVFGVLSLKLGAYIQPLIHKLLMRFNIKKEQ